MISFILGALAGSLFTSAVLWVWNGEWRRVSPIAPGAMMTPEPTPQPVRAPEPLGPFRTAGAVGDAATPETPEPEPVGFWRELVIGEWSPLLGCLITFEMSTDNRQWTSARIYAPQREREVVRKSVEGFIRSVVEAQQMSATLRNGAVR